MPNTNSLATDLPAIVSQFWLHYFGVGTAPAEAFVSEYLSGKFGRNPAIYDTLGIGFAPVHADFVVFCLGDGFG